MNNETKREIKFRGREENGIWRYGYYYYDFNDNAHKIVAVYHQPDSRDEPAHDYQVEHKVDPSTIGQFINLHGYKMREIYSGDIIKATVGHGFQKVEYTGVVTYEPQACQYWIKWTDEKGVHRFAEMRANEGSDVYSNHNYEIIGNIHDTPHLIEK